MRRTNGEIEGELEEEEYGNHNRSGSKTFIYIYIYIYFFFFFFFFFLGGGGQREARSPLWSGSRAVKRTLQEYKVFDALSCYLSLIFKHLDTNIEGKNTVDQNLGGGGSVRSVTGYDRGEKKEKKQEQHSQEELGITSNIITGRVR